MVDLQSCTREACCDLSKWDSNDPAPLQGIGIQEILEEVVQRIPAPADNRGRPLRALIFDSYYDSYKARGWRSH